METTDRKPDLIADGLVDRYGKAVLASHNVHSLQIDGAGQSIELQYDPYNHRLKLFDITPSDVRASTAIDSAVRQAQSGALYSKLIAYAREGEDFGPFGLHHEATIWGFFGNGDNAALWTRYPTAGRAGDSNKTEADRIQEIAAKKRQVEPILPEGYTCTAERIEDADEIAALMRNTFEDYPTPITTEYVRNNMKERTSYFRVVRNEAGELVACASAEIHHARRSAELTDCATRPDCRGKGLMSSILRGLEHDLAREFGISDVYTIARAVEPGMNCSFAKLGYTYTGRLINNCRMPQGYESMNVWCKDTRNAAEAV